MTAFGLGAAYGGQRLASLQHQKKQADEERHNREVQEAVTKALAARDLQEELSKSMSQFLKNNFIYYWSIVYDIISSYLFFITITTPP